MCFNVYTKAKYISCFLLWYALNSLPFLIFFEVWEVEADRITYASAMLACEEAAAWRCSFTLLSMMYEAAMPGLGTVGWGLFQPAHPLTNRDLAPFMKYCNGLIILYNKALFFLGGGRELFFGGG